MITPKVELFWWVRVGPTNRFHIVLDRDGSRAFSTGCGIYTPMIRLHTAGTVISPNKPLDESTLCRRCVAHYV